MVRFVLAGARHPCLAFVRLRDKGNPLFTPLRWAGYRPPGIANSSCSIVVTRGRPRLVNTLLWNLPRFRLLFIFLRQISGPIVRLDLVMSRLRCLVVSNAGNSFCLLLRVIGKCRILVRLLEVAENARLRVPEVLRQVLVRCWKVLLNLHSLFSESLARLLQEVAIMLVKGPRSPSGGLAPVPANFVAFVGGTWIRLVQL